MVPILGPIAVATCALFLLRLLHYQSGTTKDALWFTLPAWTFTRQELFAGRFPAWDPSRLSGTPHAANPQTGVFYPPNWLLLPLEPELSISVTVVVHVALGGILLTLFARGFRLSNAASLLAGLAYVTGGFVSARTYASHVQILQTVAWAPLLLMAARGLALESGARWAAWLAAATAMSLVAGYPVYAVYCLMAAGLLFLGSVWRGARWRNAVLLGTLAMVLAVLAAAPALWSFAELTGQTTRTGGLTTAVTAIGSLRPEYLPMLVWPWFFGAASLDSFTAGQGWFWHEIQVTAGFTLTTLAVFGATRRARTRPVQLLTLVAALFLLAAIGPSSPIYTGLTQLVPPLESTRVPARLLVIWALIVPVLAAAGFDELCSRETTRARRLFRISLLVGIAATAAQAGVLLATHVASRGTAAEATTLDHLTRASRAGLVNTAVGAAGIVGLWLVWSRYSINRLNVGAFVACAYLAILAELVIVGLPSIYSDQESIIDVTNRLGTHNLEAVAGANSRIALDSPYVLYSNLGGILGFRSVSAYDPVLLRRTTDLLRACQDVVDQWGNASSLIDLPREGGTTFDVLGVGYRIEYQPAGATIRERTTQLPRLSLVTEGRFTPTSDASLAAVLAADFDPRSEAILEEAPKTIHSDAPARGGEQIEIVEERPGYLRAEIESTRAGYLVFSESYYPGWQAEAAGRTVPLVPADHAVMAVRLGPGHHEIVLRFTTPWLAPSLVLASLGMLGMAALFAWPNVVAYRTNWSDSGS